MDFTLGAVILAAVATIVGATIQGSIGFGMNLVTVPMLALVLPESLPVTVVLLGIPISIAMLRHEHRALDRTGLGWIIGGRVPGTVLGAWVVATVDHRHAAGLHRRRSCCCSSWRASLSPPIPVRPGNPGGRGGGVRRDRHRGRHRRAADRVALPAPPRPAMRSTLAASFFFGTLLSITTLVDRGPGRAGIRSRSGSVLAPLVVAGSLLGRRFHDLLDRGWMRPAVLVFAATSAFVVILDALV